MSKNIYFTLKTLCFISYFSSQLASWYSLNKRDLPWRQTTNPYYIWLSEIILQQTRVDQGLKYYYSFVENFPTIADLANAPEDQVLRLWQGLGYYNRARNLQASAQYVHHELNDQFPDNYDELIKLKGVGDYTASAIASFAFDEKVAVLDGNVFRVLARYFGIYDDIASASSRKIFKTALDEVIPNTGKDCHIFNQAIMEFGALLCSPKKPDCLNCPIQENCVAFDKKEQLTLPIKIKKTKIRTRHIYYFIIKDDKENILMKKRDASDVWAGLYDFPSIENKEELPEEKIQLAVLKEFNQHINEFKILHSAKKHQLSHQSIYAHFIEIPKDELPLNKEGIKKFSLEEVKQLPKPIHLANFLDKFYF